MVLSALKFPESNWIRNLSKRTMLAGYVKNKTDLWKISRSVEAWNQNQKARKAQTHTGCPSWVCEKWEFTLSTPVYWRNRTHFLLPQRKQGLHPNGAHSTQRKFLESKDEKFDPHLNRQLIGSLMQLATRTRPDISYSVSVLSQFSKLLKIPSSSWGLSKEDQWQTHQCSACIFLCYSLINRIKGKQNHVLRSTTEAEFYALLEGITEVEFVRDVIHFPLCLQSWHKNLQLEKYSNSLW